MSDPMAEIRASFFVECEELLEALLDGLQLMGDGEGDSETVNVVFRAVHSIKGGAGAFGLDDLVSFAHKFETAMDEVRAENLVPDQEILKLFFVCGDILADLVREARDGEEHDPSRTERVLTQLANLIGDADEVEEEIDFQPAAISMDLDLDNSVDEGGDDHPADPQYSISFKPDDTLFSSGNEPLYLFRAVRDLGPMSVSCQAPDLPELSELSPETSHLTWQLNLTTGEGEAAIREAFEFVDGLCDLKIIKASAPELFDVPDLQDLSEAHPALPVPEPEPQGDIQPPSTTSAPAASTPTKALKPTIATKSGKPAAGNTPRATVRVDLDRIDRLVNLVGEIV
ncbi:MAG: chemotaxis protein CheA, partial [Rhodobacteraceae bacterium]|nr:chemotaxis protein CheA [Paracoccaceae bacterium]